MRSRWEQGAGTDLDEPVTLTEQQLRALRRGTRVGVLAVLLSLGAAGLATWNFLEARDAIPGMKSDAAAVAALPEPAANDTTNAGALAAGGSGGSAAEASATAAPTAQPARPRRSARVTAQTRAAEPPLSPTPMPVPFANEAPKPVARDSSASH